jgi:asparagine synthetase B (glutamine-hydrolysing)
MDIEKLKRKRQLNVQEQNALMKHRILEEASYWRTNGIPIGLQNALKDKGINTEKSIYLDYMQDFPGISTDEGIVLTQDGEFYNFDLDLNASRTELIEFYEWENITSKIEVNEHKPGTGATWGFLALKVIAELNQC